MLVHLVGGLTALGNPTAIAYLLLGSLGGVLFGVIPGIGGAVILTIALAFVYHMQIEGVLSLFLALNAASYFSASITSIILNAPAHPEAFAVTFDGFPMAQRGEAGRALGISAAATCAGGLVGCAVLVGFIQIVNQLNTVFHPPEYVALVFMALLLVGTLGAESASKSIISAGLGIMIASVGTAIITGQARYTFGVVDLLNGVSLVSLALGCFVIPQMIMVFGTASTVARQDMMGREMAADAADIDLGEGFRRQVLRGIGEALRRPLDLLRASLVGVVTGVVPGIGGFAANFLSYGIARQFSRAGPRFGTGTPEGIIAAEGSSLAKEAGGLVPLIGLGIPGGVGMALFLAALSIKGLETGYGFAQRYPTLTYEMVWVVALGGLIGTACGAVSAPWLARVTKVPGLCLVPFVVGFSVLAAFVSNVSFFNVEELLIFSLVGLVLRRLGYSLASFVIGLVLGPTLENNIYLTHNVFPGLSFLVQRPLADGLFAVAIAILILKVVEGRREAARTRHRVDRADALAAAAGEMPVELSGAHRHPVLALVTTLAIAVLAVAFVAYGLRAYDASTALMPAVGGTIVALAALWRIPLDVGAFRARRRRPPDAAWEAHRGTEVPPAHPLTGGEPSGRPEPPAAAAGAEPPPIVENAWGRHGQFTREVTALAWLLGLVAACAVLGFQLAVPAFCLAYGLGPMRRVFRRRLPLLIFALASAATMGLATRGILDILHISYPALLHL